MGWVRAALLLGIVTLGGLAVVQARLPSATSPTAPPTAQALAAAAPPTAVPPAAATATRVPLPTAPPPMIISRVARETPTPGPTATPNAQPRVNLVDNAYLPAQMQITAGARVEWVNTGGDGHDVSGNGPGGTWWSGPLAPAERYARGFALAGTYEYQCTVHPEMRGRIVVVQP